MTPHIEAKFGEYSENVLMPGDPKRAEYIAKNFLENVQLVNTVRNCLGFTGTYKNKRVSVQASGMGQASLGIYATELFKFYGVENIIRVGTCGSFFEHVNVGDLVIAMTASTESNMTSNLFSTIPNFIFSPCCSYDLLEKTVIQARALNIPHIVGPITSSDHFYQDDQNWWKELKKYGILGVEMETHVLYYLAMKYGKGALSVNMVSDNLATKQALSPEERATGVDHMIEVVLEAL